MATNDAYDLIVIGAGPGGYVAAIRAAQLGMSVACVEKEAALGGTCLRVGCIPSKAMLESSEHYHRARHGLKAHGVQAGKVTLDLAAMLRRKDTVVRTLTKGVEGLFRKNRVDRVKGEARLAGPGRVQVSGDGARELSAGHILIATGSRSGTIPGVTPDGDRIGTSTEALSYPEVPERLVVIGAGYIGLELGSVWSRLGSKVTVIEFMDRILPAADGELAEDARTILEKQGLEFRLGCRVTGARVKDGLCTVEVEGGQAVEADRVLVAVGREPNTGGLGLAEAGVETDERGRIRTGDGYAASAKHVYAVGDVIGGAMLAHKAEEEGIACVEGIAGGRGHVQYEAIPSVVYTHPELASVGKTEEELKEAGIPYRKGVFPFRANGRARTLDEADGKVKMLAHRETDRILGVHILGARAGDLIAEAAAAMAFGASSEDVARTCHAHPTLAEALKEAALAVDGRAIHA